MTMAPPLVWTPHRVLQCAAEAFRVSKSDLLSHRLDKPLALYRMVTYAAIKRFCGFSNVRTGQLFCRHSTTVLSGVRRVDSDRYLQGLYLALADRLLQEGVA